MVFSSCIKHVNFSLDIFLHGSIPFSHFSKKSHKCRVLLLSSSSSSSSLLLLLSSLSSSLLLLLLLLLLVVVHSTSRFFFQNSRLITALFKGPARPCPRSVPGANFLDAAENFEKCSPFPTGTSPQKNKTWLGIENHLIFISEVHLHQCLLFKRKSRYFSGRYCSIFIPLLQFLRPTMFWLQECDPKIFMFFKFTCHPKNHILTNSF